MVTSPTLWMRYFTARGEVNAAAGMLTCSRPRRRGDDPASVTGTPWATTGFRRCAWSLGMTRSPASSDQGDDADDGGDPRTTRSSGRPGDGGEMGETMGRPPKAAAECGSDVRAVAPRRRARLGQRVPPSYSIRSGVSLPVRADRGRPVGATLIPFPSHCQRIEFQSISDTTGTVRRYALIPERKDKNPGKSHDIITT